MAAPICLYNKFGYCKFGEKCRKYHINEICSENTCDITSCNQRHPRACRYFRDYGRCKFFPCAFKHEIDPSRNDFENKNKEIKDISERLLALEQVINDKNKEIDEMSVKIETLEKKISENNIDERLEAFEKQLLGKMEEALKSFQHYMGETCNSIDDMVVELNDDIGNITMESEDNNLLRTFDNPFKFKCDICEFIGKSERGLKSHRTRKHENCEWCEYICDSESDLKKHKMDQHYLKYSKEVLVGLMGKSP